MVPFCVRASVSGAILASIVLLWGCSSVSTGVIEVTIPGRFLKNYEQIVRSYYKSP